MEVASAADAGVVLPAYAGMIPIGSDRLGPREDTPHVCTRNSECLQPNGYGHSTNGHQSAASIPGHSPTDVPSI